jgi:hypothetical protein
MSHDFEELKRDLLVPQSRAARYSKKRDLARSEISLI